MNVALEFDDFGVNNHRLDLLLKLKERYPGFKVTMFAIPANCPDEWVDTLPDWIELAFHGWNHSPRECENWRADKVIDFLEYADNKAINGRRWVWVFRPPYWLLSDEAYNTFRDASCMKLCLHPADKRENDYTYTHNLKDQITPDLVEAMEFYGAPLLCHGHVQDVCGNGLEESFDRICQLPPDTEFYFVSEVIDAAKKDC